MADKAWPLIFITCCNHFLKFLMKFELRGAANRGVESLWFYRRPDKDL